MEKMHPKLGFLRIWGVGAFDCDLNRRLGWFEISFARPKRKKAKKEPPEGGPYINSLDYQTLPKPTAFLTSSYFSFAISFV